MVCNYMFDLEYQEPQVNLYLKETVNELLIEKMVCLAMQFSIKQAMGRIMVNGHIKQMNSIQTIPFVLECYSSH